MDADRDPRDRAPRPSNRLLIVAVAVALGLGGGWWAGNAPADTTPSGTASADTTAGQSGGATRPLSGPVPPGVPRLGIAEAEAVEAEAELPGTGLAELLLPPADDLVLRNEAVVMPQASARFEGPAPSDGDYLLQVACIGYGERHDGIDVELILPDRYPRRYPATCDLEVTAIEFTFAPGFTAIELWSRDTETPAIVAFQLVRAG